MQNWQPQRLDEGILSTPGSPEDQDLKKQLCKPKGIENIFFTPSKTASHSTWHTAFETEVDFKGTFEWSHFQKYHWASASSYGAHDIPANRLYFPGQLSPLYQKHTTQAHSAGEKNKPYCFIKMWFITCLFHVDIIKLERWWLLLNICLSLSDSSHSVG